ncbi:class I SAM-dependent methyltransferase [Achromobacter insuavis]
MHSWSLMKRKGEFFESFEPDHEVRLRYICEHLVENTQPMGYLEYLNSVNLPVVSINYFKTAEVALDADQALSACSICAAKFVLGKNDVCPGCSARARHRQVVDALNRVESPFVGKRVLACFANAIEKFAILRGAREIKNFDVRPVAEVDFQMDIQNMDDIPSESFDAFIALHVLNHVRDDKKALQEIFRVLVPGGTALITVPYREGVPTAATSDILEHYGADSFEKYGVGSYRRYGLGDVMELFGQDFDLTALSGFDSVTNSAMKVFLLKKPMMDLKIPLVLLNNK